MRILNVCVYNPPLSAASWRIDNVSRILESSGHDVEHVHYSRNPPGSSRDSASGLRHIKFVKASYLTVHAEHLRIVAKENIDLVYANTHRACFCSILGGMAGASLVFDMHGDIVGESLMSRGVLRPRLTDFPSWAKNSLIDNLAIHSSDRIICVSRRLANDLLKRGIPDECVTYATNGVNLGLFTSSRTHEIDGLRNELGLQGKTVFGYLGGSHKWQGVDSLVEAANATRIRNVAFLFVGGVTSRRTCNSVFLPHVPREAVPRYYSLCDVLVLPRPAHPATEHAAPTKFAEYLSMGKPVLVTDVGDPADYVREHRCGLVVGDNTPACLAEGIRKMAEAGDSTLKEMGLRARRLAENEFDWTKIGARIVKAIENRRT